MKSGKGYWVSAVLAALFILSACESVAISPRRDITDRSTDTYGSSEFSRSDSGRIANSRISGEIDQVDTRRQEIFLRDRDGRRQSVAYDRNTRVIFRGQDYSVNQLEPGDSIVTEVSDSRGSLYADLIRVDETAQSRRRGSLGGKDYY